MPAPLWISMTPAQRMTAGLCPECGTDLKTESPEHHLGMHWDQRLLYQAPESQANVRANMLRNFIKEIADQGKPQPKESTAAKRSALREEPEQD